MNNKRLQVWVWTIITAVYVIATFTFSNISEAGYLKQIKSIWGIRLDWFLHGVEYGLFSLLFLRWIRVAKPESSVLVSSILTLVTGFILGLLNELWQIRIPRRSFELSDIAANMIGAIIVLTLYIGLTRVNINHIRRNNVQRVK